MTSILPFLLTRLSRGATSGGGSSEFGWADFYSRASREARLEIMKKRSVEGYISTHAPLARRDLNHYFHGSNDDISTHAPLARRDRYN